MSNKRTLAEGEEVDFGLVWTEELALGDFITNSDWEVEDLTVISSSINEQAIAYEGQEIPEGHLTSAVFAGAVMNRTYRARNTVQTNNGLTFVRDIAIYGITPGLS